MWFPFGRDVATKSALKGGKCRGGEGGTSSPHCR
jgi:hypothetical protein